MERRLYFIFGDLAAAVVAGSLAGWLAMLVVPAGFQGPLAMIAAMGIGMVVGMAVGMVVGFLFVPFFGAMEPMLPASLGGMMAGMGMAMAAVMGTPTPMNATLDGAAIGALCLLYTYVQQARLFGTASTQAPNDGP